MRNLIQVITFSSNILALVLVIYLLLLSQEAVFKYIFFKQSYCRSAGVRRP